MNANESPLLRGFTIAFLISLCDRAEAIGTTMLTLIEEAEAIEWKRIEALRRAKAYRDSPRLTQMKHNAAAFDQIIANPGEWVEIGVFRSQGTAQRWRDRGCEVRCTGVGELWLIEARR